MHTGLLDDDYLKYVFEGYTKYQSSADTTTQPRSKFDDGNVIDMVQDASGAYTPSGISL